MVQTLPSVTSLFLPPVSVPGKGLVSTSRLTPPLAPPDDTIVYKVQNLQWTADFSGAVTLTWARPKRMSSTSCVYNVYYRYTTYCLNHGWLWQGKDRRNMSRGSSTHVFGAKHRTKSSPRGWSFAVYFCLENLLMLRCKADPK